MPKQPYNVIYAAFVEANDEKHKQAGFYLIVSMIDGSTYKGALMSPTKDNVDYHNYFRLSLPDLDNKKSRDLILATQHVVAVEIEW